MIEYGTHDQYKWYHLKNAIQFQLNHVTKRYPKYIVDKPSKMICYPSIQPKLYNNRYFSYGNALYYLYSPTQSITTNKLSIIYPKVHDLFSISSTTFQEQELHPLKLIYGKRGA